MARITYSFYYSAKDDGIQFMYQFEGTPTVLIQLPAEVFLKLISDVVNLANPFLEEVNKKRAAGIKEDVKATFDVAKWEKMMGENKEQEDRNGREDK